MRTHTKYLLASAIALALLTTPLAFGAGEGRPLNGGTRNPSSNASLELSRETEIIANTATYGTRQSNKSTSGGGAVYGCRSRAGGTPRNNEPCVRATNLADGRAFEFSTNTGAEVGRIEATNTAAKPFTTNATGVADGLNADRVDSKSADEIASDARAFNRFAAVRADGALIAGRGAVGATRTAEGIFTVTFGVDVNACAYSATIVGGDPPAGFASVEPIDPRTIRVRTRAAGGDNPLTSRDFHLIAIC